MQFAAIMQGVLKSLLLAAESEAGLHWEQVSMQLKAGVMKDHEGTYIESVAFAYQEHSILVELLADDSVAGGQQHLTAQLIEDHAECSLWDGGVGVAAMS